MTDDTKRNQAILLVENDNLAKGYQYGSCLNAEQLLPDDDSKWLVEFAHKGLTARSPTTDPPSCRFEVDLSTKEVRLIDLM